MKRFLLILLLALPLWAPAAITAKTVWEVRTDGSDINGGGFDSTLAGAGTDYSQQASAQVSVTDIVANGTTTITSATATWTSAMVGNTIYMAGGTGSLAATWRQVTGFTNSTTITVDATVATGTGITGHLGGALATIDQAAFTNHTPACPAVAGSTVYVNYTTGTPYTTAGNGILQGGDGTSRPFLLVGYDGTPANRKPYNRSTNRPTWQLSAANPYWSSIGGTSAIARVTCLKLDLNGQVNQAFIGNQVSIRCSIINIKGDGSNIWTGAAAYECDITIAAGKLFNDAFLCPCWGCRCTSAWASDNGVMFVSSCVGCIAIYNGVGQRGTAFSVGSTGQMELGNIADGVKVGFEGNSNPYPISIVDCVAANCVTGYAGDQAPYMWGTRACAAYNCTTSVKTDLDPDLQIKSDLTQGVIALSANPFTNSAGGDYTLNSLAGGGAALRAAGWPFLFGTQIGYPDVGAYQHQDSGGSSGSRFIGG